MSRELDVVDVRGGEVEREVCVLEVVLELDAVLLLLVASDEDVDVVCSLSPRRHCVGCRG